MIESIAQLEARAEGWIWWLAVVFGLTVALLAVVALRRRVLRPMRHTPSDTSDAWTEAGRRMPVPPRTAENEPPEETGN